MLAKMLDERADKISNELAEARKLREEAQALLAEYQKKRAEAENDAANIVAQAKVEADPTALKPARSWQKPSSADQAGGAENRPGRSRRHQGSAHHRNRSRHRRRLQAGWRSGSGRQGRKAHRRVNRRGEEPAELASRPVEALAGPGIEDRQSTTDKGHSISCDDTKLVFLCHRCDQEIYPRRRFAGQFPLARNDAPAQQYVLINLKHAPCKPWTHDCFYPMLQVAPFQNIRNRACAISQFRKIFIFEVKSCESWLPLIHSRTFSEGRRLFVSEMTFVSTSQFIRMKSRAMCCLWALTEYQNRLEDRTSPPSNRAC